MLSAYKVSTSLSSRLNAPSGLKKAIGVQLGDFDKRVGSLQQSAATVADTVKDVADTVANAFGIRSPYYVIGEIPTDGKIKGAWSDFDKSAIVTFRAVASAMSWTNKQEGVIIDSLGDISSTMSVEFTSKPLFYQTSTSIDSRLRKPTTLRSTVAVSNYRSDDAVGGLANYLSSYDPTGLLELAKDNLLYGGNTRAQYALYKLRWLMENGEPFTVYTPHGYYENMLIQSISPRTDANNMDMLLCDIVYQEAILAAPYEQPGKLKERSATRTVVESTGSSAKSLFSKLIA